MTHAKRPINKRTLSRYRRDLQDAAIPATATFNNSIPFAVSSLKQLVETLVNARGHSADSIGQGLEETQRFHDLFDPVGFRQRYTLVSEDYYAVKPSDQVVVVDTATGARNLTLPLSTAEYLCWNLIVACVGNNTLTLRVQGSDLINGGSTLTLGIGGPPPNYVARHLLPIHNGWLAM